MGVVAVTDAKPVSPVHRFEPQLLVLVVKLNAFTSVEGVTVTATLTCWLAESCTVMVTSVVAVTLFASSGIVEPATVWVTGSTPGLSENAKNGAAPLVIVMLVGWPA